jgi:glyoxylase-like metal-dependent hydrolase (beta-lactamase superfamily II)
MTSRSGWFSRWGSFVLLGTFVLASCAGQQDSTPTVVATENDEAVTESSLKLYVFECGRLRFDTVANFGVNDDETDVRELVVPCYIVDHPEGRMLWDGGLPSSIKYDDDGRDENGWVGNAKLRYTLAEQIVSVGLEFDLSSLDYMAFSHIHYDHVGVANEMSGATWLVQRGDYEAAFAEPITVPAVQPELLTNLRDADRLILDGDHDVFGDGRVRLISAPGHTPGHQVLFLDLAWAGPLVLSGDLYHFRISRDDRRVPVFNVDPELSLQSMDKVEAFVAEQGAMFWIEHDLALFQTLQTAPRYYE